MTRQGSGCSDRIHFWQLVRLEMNSTARNAHRLGINASTIIYLLVLLLAFQVILVWKQQNLSFNFGNFRKRSDVIQLTNQATVKSEENDIARVQTRVACLIPYIGSSLPPWFDAFAFTAQSSAPLFDYFIFVTEVPDRELPSNVKLIRMLPADLHDRIARIDNKKSTLKEFERTVLSVKLLIERFPYVLVEFKPCFGYIFADYIQPYSHWAIADLDVLVGNTHNAITPEMLNQYDIYTSSFGDNFRFYMRGQLTIHNNNDYTNNLWRGCRHLSHLSDRLQTFYNSGMRSWNFQSAEGCYSAVVGVLHMYNVFYGVRCVAHFRLLKHSQRKQFIHHHIYCSTNFHILSNTSTT